MQEDHLCLGVQSQAEQHSDTLTQQEKKKKNPSTLSKQFLSLAFKLLWSFELKNPEGSFSVIDQTDKAQIPLLFLLGWVCAFVSSAL